VSNEWIAFFNVMTPVAGAFLPLLFVALQVGADKWRGFPLRHLAAVRNLVELGTPLTVGLFALHPGGTWWLGGYFAGSFGLATTLMYVFVYIRELHSHSPMTWYEHFQGIGGSILPPIFYVLLLIGSCHNDNFGLRLVGWLCIWALMSGLSQSWLLLIVRKPDPTAASQIPASPTGYQP
jgi:hypothetical protein